MPSLIEAIGGMGAPITIRPVLAKTTGWSLSAPEPVEGAYIAGWDITYETLNGTFTVSGETVRQAVEAAFAHPEAWK